MGWNTRTPHLKTTFKARRIERAWLAALFALGVSGCGGGGTGDFGGNPPPAVGSAGSGTVTVAVRDALGDPISHQWVAVSFAAGYLEESTDADGRATFAGVPPGHVVAASSSSDARGAFSGWVESSLPHNGHLELEIDLAPSDVASVVLPSGWVDAGNVSADGRSVQLSFQILSMPGGPYGIYLFGCEPDATNDVPVGQPDCVAGTAGSDAPYAAPGYDQSLTLSATEGEAPAPFYVALLLDQGGAMAVNDPADARLFAVKYFLTTLHSEDRVLLAAFAADDATSGQRSLLPQSPVALLPDENAQFAAADRAWFAAVDLLAAVEGGASPLYEAIDRMLDFTAAHAPQGARRAVAVLSSGTDLTCGSQSQCQLARDALIAKSRATGVSIVVVGFAGTGAEVDLRSLSALAQGGSGAALWVRDVKDLTGTFGGLSGVLDGSAERVSAVYRVESTTAGAFAPGRTVLGRIEAEYPPCPMGCDVVSIPFAAGVR